MKYEYDFEVIKLTEQQQHLVQLGMADLDELNNLVLEIINKRGLDGWEALYPFSVPSVWFKRVVKNTRKRVENSNE